MASADVLWSFVGAIYLIVVIIAVVQIFRTKAISGIAGGLWVLAVIVIPVLGPLAWFLLHPVTPTEKSKAP